MIKRIGINALWLLGMLFVFAGINKNDPYMVPLRGFGNAAIVVMSLAIACVLVRHAMRSGSGVARKLLIGLWCVAPLSMLATYATFEIRKYNVLNTERSDAHTLGRHFVVGY